MSAALYGLYRLRTTQGCRKSDIATISPVLHWIADDIPVTMTCVTGVCLLIRMIVMLCTVIWVFYTCRHLNAILG